MNGKSKKIGRAASVLAVLAAAACTVAAGAAYYRESDIPVIAPFVKAAANDSVMYFDKSDFIATAATDRVLDGIVISSLPSADDAVLNFGDRELTPFEGIAAESISRLSLTPAPGGQTSATFAFYPVFEGVCDACPESYVTVNFSENPGTAPIAENLCFETYKNISICGKFKAVDLEGDPISYKITEQPKLGEITTEADGFRYTPYPDKHGKDSFTYTAADDRGNMSEPACVEITVKNRSQKNQICYNDMRDNPAHYAAIKLAERNIITGRKIGECFFFSPDEPVTRSEFVAMAVCAADMKIPSAALNTGLADDQSISAWAKPYVSAALNAGVIRGAINSDGERVFMPDKNITLAEAAVIINNISGVGTDGRTAAFTDAEDIPVWAAQAMINMDSASVIAVDSSGAVNPSKPLCRADAAQMLYSAARIIK